MASPTPHAAFMADQPAPHPVLQQILTLNDKYKDVQRIDVEAVATTSGQAGDGSGEIVDELGRITQDEVHESISEEVFSSYRHREILPGCKPHPGDIVEAGPLAALQPPDTYYPLAETLAGEIIDEGKLSSLQLEGVIHACQRHQMILPNGQRAGFFIGDAAGVGKGRQIAGVMLDNFARGRTKSIWFTISTDLIVDARRDLTDLGCYIKVIDGCQELDKHTRVLGLPTDFREGVVFSTYATLVSTVQKGGAFSTSKKTRLQQLVSWCGGEDFDGCLVFDECHKAKNFVPGKEQASTKVAVAVTSIQRMLPKARVLYCSATGVSDVKNMAFMERLGLWGDGAPYKSFEQFLVSIQKKGLGMAEMLAMEMKSAGMYVSRGLSYKEAEFLTVAATLTKGQMKIYDTAAHVWNELRKALESAVVRTTQGTNRVWQQFWSSHQRFFKQLCLGMKVPTIVIESQTALDQGQCVVIGLQTTGEASLDSELGKTKGNVSGFVSLCREILRRFIEQHFPTQIVSINEGVVREDPWSVTAKKMLLDFTEKIPLPNSPLDEIIDKLGGPAMVSEMTGRKGRIVRRSPRDKPEYVTRTPDTDAYGAIDSLNVQERNQFMSGKKLVAIISDAASTGISLHSDLRAGNQRRRVHLTVELPWSADKAVQQLGRSHRSNQACGPLYKLLTTDLGGERRFAAAVARRLQSLGALTKGDRRAATGADLSEFNFDTPYGRHALRNMYTHISNKTMVPGLTPETLSDGKYTLEKFNTHMQECLVLMGLVDIDMLRSGPVLKEKDTGDVGKFLNRILGLTVERQNMIFTYFTECMKLGIQHAKSEGRYNEGMLDITASSVEMIGKPKEILTDFNKGHMSTRLVELNVDRGFKWDKAVARLENHKGRNDGFYVSKREVWGKKLYMLATQKENSTHLFTIARPNTGLSLFEEEKTDLFHRYVAIETEVAEKHWTEQYDATEVSCVHGKHCKNKGFCKVGSRCYRLHLLCGSIVSMMNTLETTLARNAVKLNLSKSESTIRVVRVKLNDGERVVGIRYPEVLIPEVEKTLKEQRLIEQAQHSHMKQLLLSQSLPLNGTFLPGLAAQLSQAGGNGVGPLSQSGVPGSIPGTHVATIPRNSSLEQSSVAQTSVLQNGMVPCSSTAGLHQTGSVLPNRVPDGKSPSQTGSQTSSRNGSATSSQNSSQSQSGSDNHLNSNLVDNVTSVKASKAVVEDVTAINSKKLAKAFKPPITIKNFFITSNKNTDLNSKPTNDVTVDSSTDQSDCKTNGHSNGHEVTRTGKSDSCDKAARPTLAREISYEDFLKSQSDENNSETVDKNLVKDTKNQPSSNGAIVVLEDNIVNSKPSKKRGLDDDKMYRPAKKAKQMSLMSSFASVSAKKAKQMSLMSSFASVSAKEKEAVKTTTCPICDKVFDKGISNADLNAHIDNCIIE